MLAAAETCSRRGPKGEDWTGRGPKGVDWTGRSPEGVDWPDRSWSKGCRLDRLWSKWCNHHPSAPLAGMFCTTVFHRSWSSIALLSSSGPMRVFLDNIRG